MHSTKSPRKLKSSALFCLAFCFAGAAAVAGDPYWVLAENLPARCHLTL